MVDFTPPVPLGRNLSPSSTSALGLKGRGLPKELALDLLQLALDLAGIADPTPVCDGTSALIAIARGNWLDAALSGVSILPYVGDLAKAGKLPRYARAVDNALEFASRTREAAEAIAPPLRRILAAIEMFPPNANRYMDQMRARIRRFLGRQKVPVERTRLPDVRQNFTFREVGTKTINGTEYRIRTASGRLGVPGRIRTFRVEGAQRGVSGGTGDDAGHLIATRFGAPGDTRNLELQNRVQNRGGGTYYKVEEHWARQLKRGIGIDVTVTIQTPIDIDRPAQRIVEWVEIGLDGSRRKADPLWFLNTHTPTSRELQGIRPTHTTPQSDNLLFMEDCR